MTHGRTGIGIKIGVVFVLLFGLALPLKQVSLASSFTLLPTDFGFVDDEQSDTNLVLLFGIIGVHHFGTREQRSFLKFDLSLIPQSEVITSLTLAAKWTSVSQFSPPFPIDIRHVSNDAWQTANVTWNNQPGTDILLGSIDFDPDNPTQPNRREWDLSEFDYSSDLQDGFLSIAMIASNPNTATGVNFAISPPATPFIVIETVAQVCVPPPAGLIAWWPGDVDASDISGNGNDAQLLSGAVAGVAGKVGGAFSFDGQNDIANTALGVGTQGTIDLWVKPSSLVGPHGIMGTDGLSNGNDRLWLTAFGPQGGPGAAGNRLTVNLGDCCVNAIDIPSPLSVGEWTHLAVTFDYSADEYILYVNGLPVASTLALRDVPTQTLEFGGFRSDFGQNFFFHGLIDEVEVFDRVLGQNEIEAIFNAGSAGKCKTEPNQPPEALCQDRTVPAGASCTASANVDNGSIDPDGDDITLTQDPAPPYDLGDTVVTLTVEDDLGAADSCQATVTVVDDEIPIVSCPVDPILECRGPNGANATVNASATDNCSVESVTCDPSSGLFPIGMTDVTCSATDGSGNSDDCETTVTVVDTTPPELTPPDDVQDECAAPGGTAVNIGNADSPDVCDMFVTVSNNAPTLFSPGTTTVTWTATDADSNQSTAPQTVTINDTLPPEITCGSPATIVQPDAPIAFTATAVDQCQGAITPVITSFDCFQFTKKGKRIDKTESCQVAINGDTITILDSGGVNDNISWNVNVTDSNGNQMNEVCEVLVVNPGKKP